MFLEKGYIQYFDHLIFICIDSKKIYFETIVVILKDKFKVSNSETLSIT